MADLILTFTLSAHNFVLCNKKLLIEHDTLFSINIFIFWHIAHLHHNETIRNTVVNLLLQLKHAEYVESCIEQLAWDFCSLACFSIVQVSHLGRWSSHYYNRSEEYRNRKWMEDLEARGKWYVEELFA